MEVSLSTVAMGFVPVVMVLVSLSKGYLDSKYAPLVSLGLCLLASFFLIPSGDVVHTVLQGVLMSLAASGLYSGGKALGGSTATA